MKLHNTRLFVIFGLLALTIIIVFPTIDAQTATNSMINKSAALLEAGNTEEAIPILEKILENDPENLTVLKNLSVAYYRMNMCTEAIELYDKILVLKPNYPEILYGKAICFNDLGQPENALLVLDKIDKQHSNDNSILITKANANVLLREFEVAKKYYQQVLDKHPQHNVAIINMSMIAHHLNDHALAEKYLTKILGNEPKRTSSCGSTGCMGNIPFLFPVKNSQNYEITVQIQVRNASNELIAIIESNTINYTPHPILEQILANYDVVDTIQNESGTFEITKIVQKSKPTINSYFMDRVEFFHNDYTVLFGYNLAIPLESGDYIITEWLIKKKI